MRIRLATTLLICVASCLATATSAQAAALAPSSQQVLRVAVGTFGERGSLDPGAVSSVDSVNRIRPLLAPLYDAGPGGRLVPRLASGQPIVSADRRRVTVRLRAARWSDGTRISSRDVATAITRARTLENYFAGFTGSIRRITTPNASTVVLHLARPDAVIVPALTTTVFTPVPTHVIRRAGARWTAPGTMVSSGPFVLRSSNRASRVMVRNPRYYAAHGVRLQRLELRAGGATMIRSGLRRGTIDLATQNVLPRNHGAGTAVRRVLAPTQAMQFAYLNTRNPGLSDARARRGIALAIDRARIATITGGTVATSFAPTTLTAPSAAAPVSQLLSSDGAPAADAARALLAEAEWPASRTLTIAYARSSQASAIAVVVRDSLAAAGVAVQLQPFDVDRFFVKGVGISPIRGNIDIVLAGWIPDVPDRFDYYQLYTCASIDAGLNASNFCDSGYDQVAQLNDRRVGAARGPWFSQLETLLSGTDGLMPAVPLYEQVDHVLHQRWVRRPAPRVDSLFDFEKMAIERR